MTEKLPDDLQPNDFLSLREVIAYVARQHSDLPAYSCLGSTLTYSELDRLSDQFASYLQSKTRLVAGDRIAIQLPNLLQFPVALYGAIKAGLVVVTTNPLYTTKEMLHQYRDSEVRAIVILENFCSKLEAIIPETSIETVIVTKLGDLQGPVKRSLINFTMKYIKRAVPAYQLKNLVSFTAALNTPITAIDSSGFAEKDELAVLLYTGGTTGFAKGAMLSHRNLITNMMQLRVRCLLVIRDRVENIVAPLPLYHSYAFLLHGLVMPFAGNHNILIPNPRDLDGLVKLLRKTVINGFVGINTLYLSLLRHKDFSSVDFSQLRFCGAGGMAMSTSVSQEWLEVTGNEIIEGYGLTECSPVVTVNIPGKIKTGTVGPVVPETEINIVDDAGNTVERGERGELWVRGPQVMLGYWQQEEETKAAFSDEGWLKTGDYVEEDEQGYLSVVDRKKDMIIVSGFNVFPNEIEDWVCQYTKVVECAAIGIPNEKTGESVKLFVVSAEKSCSEDDILNHCKQGLTAYKMPRHIEFVTDLPKSNIGKILRRELREP